MTVQDGQEGVPGQEPDDEQAPDWVKALRKKAKNADELEKQNQELQKQLAVRDAGLNPQENLTELFLKGYDGEWTADAVKEAAAKYGLVDSEGSEGQEETGEQAVQRQQQEEAQRRIQQAGQNAQQSGGEEKPAWAEAKTKDELLANYDGQMWQDD